jgi:alkylated DNA repair dioxygenase AlkB
MSVGHGLFGDLFDDRECQRLPISDGELLFWPRIDLGQNNASLLEKLIRESAWRQEEITVYGKAYRQPRLSAWYGDLGYSYSGIRLEPLPFTDTLLDIRARVQDLVEQPFNSVLLNYYRNQDDRMGMHSDDESELGVQPVIASLSLGETRNMMLRHKSRKDLKTIKLPLPSASLLVMRGDTQQFWRHGINAAKPVCGPRINLTFRNVSAPSTRDPSR